MNNKMLRLLKLIIWIAALWGLIFYINYSSFKNTKLTENKTISIISGDTIIPALQRELGINGFYLKIYLKLNPEKTVKPQIWEYSLLKWEDIDSILKTINYGAMTVDKKLVFLEWWNIYDIDDYLTKSELISPWEFISETQNISKYAQKYSFIENTSSLEGFLYPDTYFVNPKQFSSQDLIEKMLENFRQKIYANLLSTLSHTQQYDVIKLASIVEKEEKNSLEKPTVAGILKKRYSEWWMIGADATACYAYKLTWEDCKMQLSNYIYEKNEYNTRTMVWLPKTPIWNPSFESVNAVINSKTTPYYYYLHGKDGVIHYAQTNEEHVANKKYLK